MDAAALPAGLPWRGILAQLSGFCHLQLLAVVRVFTSASVANCTACLIVIDARKNY